MEIQDIRILRLEVETKICSLLIDFQDKTKVKIKEIDIISVNTGQCNPVYEVIGVRLKIEL